jgi:hypothetical protein
MVVRTRATLGWAGTLLKPKVTAGRMGAKAPASRPSQAILAVLMRWTSVTP